ncbi:MAG TPA: hypothetical protein VGB73_18755 [Pyrinomonadaceae bacterium]|jgi:hypothetical protein
MAEEEEDDDGVRLPRGEAESGSTAMSETEIDHNVMGSFPASDPPSWTLGIDQHRKSPGALEEEAPSPAEPSHRNESEPSA